MREDFPVLINDALLVAAILSVSDEDDLHPTNLAAVISITTMYLVYARHGRELLGLKSPVREPVYA